MDMTVTTDLHFHRLGEPTAVALGFFDAIHLAHRQVITRCVQRAGNALAPCVFTFADHPSNVLKGELTPLLLSAHQKQREIAGLGIKKLFAVSFEHIYTLTPEQFIQEILVDRLHTKIAVCGFNFTCGYGSPANAQDFRALCAKKGIQVDICEPVLDDGEPVSSTRIRRCVQAGDMEGAARMLGRYFTIDFPVVVGQRLGRTLGFPTINQPFPLNHCIPRFGVYASQARVDGVWHTAVTNVGVHPTVGIIEPQAETWIAGIDRNLYGQPVEVAIVKHMRDEVKFNSVEELSEAVHQDGVRAQEIIEQLTT